MSVVDEKLAAYPQQVRAALQHLRDLIHQTARDTPGTGTIEESLKWGQPSFATVRPKSGSPIRVDQTKLADGYALYFVCHTHLVDRFREIYPDSFTFEGDRALLFKLGDPLPEVELKHCIAMALTYNLMP